MARYDRRLKVILVGPSGCGKTCLAHRMCCDKFDRDPSPTIGAGFASTVRDRVRYDLWDTAGQERFRSLVPVYARHADAIWLFAVIGEPFDASRASFPSTDAPVFLVHSKCDLCGGDGREHGVQYTSAKTGEGCSELLSVTAARVPAKRERDPYLDANVAEGAEVGETRCCA